MRMYLSQEAGACQAVPHSFWLILSPGLICLGTYRALSCESEGERCTQKKKKKNEENHVRVKTDKLVAILNINMGF